MTTDTATQFTIDTLSLERTMRTRRNVLRDLVTDAEANLEHSSRSFAHRVEAFSRLQMLRDMKAQYEAMVEMAVTMSQNAIDNLDD